MFSSKFETGFKTIKNIDIHTYMKRFRNNDMEICAQKSMLLVRNTAKCF